MQSILELLSEYTDISIPLTDNQIVEIYKATTEEEKEQYMKDIQDYMESPHITDYEQRLASAISYINTESYIYKNKLI